MKLSELSVKRPVLATMMSLSLVLFGIIGLMRLAVRELPDIDPPIINVQTVYPGASSEIVETQITEPIEDTLTSIEGIKKIASESREQLSSITLEFDLSRNIEVAAQDVRDRIARVRGRLPDDIDEPIVAKQDADARPSIWVSLYSDRFSTLELTATAENIFKDRLQTVPGVSSVIFGGSKRFAIRLWLDSEKMAAREVTVLDVRDALQQQSVELPSGRVESKDRELAIQTKGQLKTPKEYNNLVIKQEGATFVRLQDVGFAKAGVEDERSLARYNTRPAVGIGIVKQSKANLIEVAHGIKKELDAIRPILPAGIMVSIPYDESIYVEKSIKEVWITLALAFFLVVLTIYIFLHSFRATLVPSVTIPVSITATFAVLYVFGYSINIVTMLAFVLAIGLVVDDAIVVLENIHRHIEQGLSAFQAAIAGMKEIGFAVIATTVALVAVFLPLAFQTSVTGRLFIEFAVAISVGVIISTFVALTLAPMISSRILKGGSNQGREAGGFDRCLRWITERYGRSLAWFLRYPFVIVFLSLCVMGIAIFFYTQLDKEFLPEEDKGRLFCIALAPEGATSEYTNRMVRKMEEIIKSTPEVDGFFSAVALAREGPGQASQGLSFIRLKEERARHVRDIVGGPQGLRARFFNEVEGAIVIPIIPKAIGGGFSQNFQLVLQHQDLGELNEFAEEFSNILRASGLLMNVRSTFKLNKPELRISIDRDRAAVLGVSIEDISRTLQIMLGGSDLAKVNLSGKEYDVIVQLERKSRLSPSDLDRLYVRNRAGELIQLTNVIHYQTGGGPSAINHFNRMRSATIEATPVGVPLGTVVEHVETLLTENLPPGFRYEWDGEASDLIEAGDETIFVLLLAVVVIYMVLAAQFESLVHPLTIMLTIPLAAVGAFGALWIMGSLDQMITSLTPDSWLFGKLPRIPAMGINLFSQIGMVLLLGIVTKNGILLVDFANQQVAKGKTAYEAIVIAGQIRLRPILMTATSTIAGIMPIAIGFGAGAESRRPLGVAAIGGILTSTFLTLFVIPVFYVLLDKLKRNSISHLAIGGTSIVLLSCVFLSGCSTVGPDYDPPEIIPPTKWKSVDDLGQWKLATPKDEAPKGPWWEIFNDPILNKLEQQASTFNQNLASAMATVIQSRAIARVDAAEFYPALDLSPEYERRRRTKSSFTSSSATSKSFTFDFYRIPLDLSYEVDVWGRVRRAFEAAEADFEADLAAFQTVQLTLASDVAQVYFSIRGLDQEIEILEETIKLRRDAHNLVKQRAEGGVTSELDLNRAKTELAKAKVEKVDVRRRRNTLENTLAILCGQFASGFSIESKRLKQAPPMVPINLPSELLERRPDIAETERLVAAANARIGVAKAAFFPVFKLTGGGGYESVTSGNLLNWESRVWSLGPSISLPLFSGGRNKANLEASRAQYDKTVAGYRQKVLEAVGEAENAITNLQMHAEKGKFQRKVVEAARATAELSLSRYKQGLVTFLEVVDAERARLDAELDATQILNDQLISTVLLVKALGGGWERQ